MSHFYCRCCNVRKVENDGDICQSCQDPYQQQPVVSAPTNDPMQVVNAYLPSSADDSSSYTDVAPDSTDDAGGASIQHKSNRHLLNVGGNSSAPSRGSRRKIMTQQNATPTPVQPSMSNTPVVPVVPQNNTAAQPTGKNAPQTEGIVRNIQESQDTNVSAASRWFQALFGSIPFTTSPDITEFQVFPNWSSGVQASSNAPSADKVIVYGHIRSGKPIQDNSVRVYGTRQKNRAIVATMIENTTDGTITELDPPPLSCGTVRFITFGLLALVILVFVMIGSSSGGSLSAFGSWLIYLLLTAASAFGVWFSFRNVISGPPGARTFNFILMAVCLLLVFSFGAELF